MIRINNISVTHPSYNVAGVTDSVFFDTPNITNCSFSGNIENVSEFALFDSVSYYNYLPIDFHIKPSSVGHNAGSDGTDVGIYGGIYPWKEGMVPSNPHFRYHNISPFNNSQGDIQVDIKVDAQSH